MKYNKIEVTQKEIDDLFKEKEALDYITNFRWQIQDVYLK